MRLSRFPDSEITIAVGTMKEMGQPGEMDRMAEHRMETAEGGVRLLCWI